MFGNATFLVPILIVGLLFLYLAVKILREYERGVVFTLGRFTGVKGPGLIILVPLIQQMVRVDQRTMVLDVPTQDVISSDNVSASASRLPGIRASKEQVREPHGATADPVDHP